MNGPETKQHCEKDINTEERECGGRKRRVAVGLKEWWGHETENRKGCSIVGKSKAKKKSKKKENKQKIKKKKKKKKKKQKRKKKKKKKTREKSNLSGGEGA